MLCAIYFTPPPEDALAAAAIRWIGRDAYTGRRFTGVETPGLTESDRDYLTAPVRRFGFHGTLKAPFRMAASHQLAELEAALAGFARHQESVLLPAMQLVSMDTYFALSPQEPSAALSGLAGAIVAAFDHFRGPLDENDTGRWSRLAGRQLDNLLRWGYPFIFDDFRFHMALTGPVPAQERDHVRTVIDRYFGPLLTAPIVVDQFALFTEPEPNAPLRVHSVHRLAAAGLTRKSA